MACSSYTKMKILSVPNAMLFSPYYWVLGSEAPGSAITKILSAPDISCLDWGGNPRNAGIPYIWNEGTQRWVHKDDFVDNAQNDNRWTAVEHNSTLSDIEWDDSRIGRRIQAFNENLLWALGPLGRPAQPIDTYQLAAAHPDGYLFLGEITSGGRTYLSDGYPGVLVEGQYGGYFPKYNQTSTAHIRPIPYRKTSEKTENEVALTAEFNARPTLDQTVPYYDWLCLYHEHVAQALAKTHNTHRQRSQEKNNIAAVRRWYKARGWNPDRADSRPEQSKAHSLLMGRIEKSKNVKVEHIARTFFVKWLTAYTAAEAAGSEALAEYLASQEGSTPQVEPQDPEMLEDIEWSMEEVARTKLQEALPWIVLASTFAIGSGSYWWFRKKRKELV